MSDKKRQLLVPHYMQQFACIGSACEDTCCAGWAVSIDQSTYRKYNKVRDSVLKPLLDKKVTRNRTNPTDANYAKIKLNEDAKCPLLNETGLCKIQVQLGEELLSDTCATYPRVTNQTNGVMERSASVSCPEIARLALLNPDGMEFDEIEESADVRFRFTRRLDERTESAPDKAQKHFWELRIISIQILQNRSYKLADRLVILGMLFNKVQEYVEAKRVDEIPLLIAEYTRLLEDGSMKAGLNSIPVLYAIQMEIMKGISDERYVLGVNNSRYIECFTETLHGISYTENTPVEEIAERYKYAHDLYFKPLMDQHEYIMENYLVNYVFKNMFPFGGHPSVVDDYIIMVIHYALIKLHLIGMSGFHKDAFCIELVLKLIQSFAKSIEHSPLFLRKVYDLLKNNGYTSMAYMSILIKN
ncbi:flagellin lysine-N-methylase [Paenibacillus eucommiae]|uniref:Lysine-N-methylase n=1 Tax=Paenibacillus eucommiae TaxID=1355755 RepID=A0ABS4IYI0_9BACL|nr:flagellin lysine-N-methylase [Paenibacillus eucommiae]MBP1992648.1 lysine-N-methylase [Paenibacillus eucommiae]